MSEEYYERKQARHLDGSLIFQTPADLAAEEKIAAELAAEFGCEVRHFAPLCPIDWYAVRAGRIIGCMEFKRRAHSVKQYPTVFLGVRKWLALQLCAMGLGVPGFFIVQWNDETRVISLESIDARRLTMSQGWRPPSAPAAAAYEPVIEIDIYKMGTLKDEAARQKASAEADANY